MCAYFCFTLHFYSLLSCCFQPKSVLRTHLALACNGQWKMSLKCFCCFTLIIHHTHLTCAYTERRAYMPCSMCTGARFSSRNVECIFGELNITANRRAVSFPSKVRKVSKCTRAMCFGSVEQFDSSLLCIFCVVSIVIWHHRNSFAIANNNCNFVLYFLSVCARAPHCVHQTQCQFWIIHWTGG